MLSPGRVRPPVGAYPLPGVVPYIVLWSSEVVDSPAVRAGRHGIRLEGEKPYHRDDSGVLWRPQPSTSGRGTPLFGKVHGQRQRNAIAGLLCQVCAAPADRDEQGVLWLVDEDLRALPRLPSRLATVHPPLCLPCARTSLALCPRLRTAWTALRVGRVRRVGIFGALYEPGIPAPRLTAATGVRYGDPKLDWLLGQQYILHLLDYTVVDLAPEAAAHP